MNENIQNNNDGILVSFMFFEYHRIIKSLPIDVQSYLFNIFRMKHVYYQMKSQLIFNQNLKKNYNHRTKGYICNCLHYYI